MGYITRQKSFILYLLITNVFYPIAVAVIFQNELIYLCVFYAYQQTFIPVNH